MTMIKACTKIHATTQQVRMQAFSYYPDRVMTDGAALAVASWYQSSRGFGAVFAQLASTGGVDHMELIEAVEHSARQHATKGTDHKSLTMLIMWALDKASRTQG